MTRHFLSTRRQCQVAPKQFPAHLDNLSARLCATGKRQGTAAVQDAGASSCAAWFTASKPCEDGLARSVLECGSPLPLWEEDYSSSEFRINSTAVARPPSVATTAEDGLLHDCIVPLRCPRQGCVARSEFRATSQRAVSTSLKNACMCAAPPSESKVTRSRSMMARSRA